MTCFADIEPKAYGFHRHTGVPTFVPMSVEDWLTSHHLAAGEAEQEQALRQCPPLVRAAIAANLRWWFLARSHSAVVRTFAHAVITSLWWNGSYSQQGLHLWHQSPRERGRLACLRGTNKSKAHRMLPYRVLHFFGNYLGQMKVTAQAAGDMTPRAWADSLRCNPTLHSSSRGYDCENVPNVAAYCNQDEYDTALNAGGLLRSTVGRMDAFAEAAEAAMQPLLGLEFQTSTSKGRLAAPVTLVNRPRSKVTKSMIPRHLAHGMEQLAEELPYAVRWIHQHYEYRNWVRKEAEQYGDFREENAMQAMAKRDSVSEWLHQLDSLAAVQWCMPAAADRRVSMCHDNYNEPTFNHNATLTIPGVAAHREE